MFRLNHLFKRADAAQRHLAAALARSRLAYLAHRAEQGARSSTLRGIAALQVKVIHYLELGEQGKVARPDIEAAARRWVSQDPARRGGNADVAQHHFISHATCWLRFSGRFSGRLEDSAISTHPRSGVVADFVDYMRQERGWSEATIRDRRARADDFLRRFCATTGALAEVTIATIDQALSENNARTGRPRCRTTIRTHADALRAFFRFAEDRGWNRPGVAAAIVAPRVYRDAALPVGPSGESSGSCSRRPRVTVRRTCATGHSCSRFRRTACASGKCAPCSSTTSTGRRRRYAFAAPRRGASTFFRCRAASERPLHATSVTPDLIPMSGRSFSRSRRRPVPSAPPRYRASCEAACSAAASNARVAEHTRYAMPSHSVYWTRDS